MNGVTDSELQARCFRALVEAVGYYGTERFIVMMNRAPGDYTAWHEAQGDSEETIEELGTKIMAFDRVTAPCETVGSL